MPTTILDVQVTAAEPGPTGRDDVTFGLIAHEGATAVPLHKGASGGELSRVMLGLEVVLAGNDPVGTYVFDEVDAGIGGEAALAVGQRLAQLGRTAQVLVVTHLAQVAAFADHHFVVTKASKGGFTASDVRRVDEGERATELARMLAGMSDSERGRAHADELLQKASDMLAGPSA
jgi:DNA repair protein RecN (Recombination protein N)